MSLSANNQIPSSKMRQGDLENLILMGLIKDKMDLKDLASTTTAI